MLLGAGAHHKLYVTIYTTPKSTESTLSSNKSNSSRLRERGLGRVVVMADAADSASSPSFFKKHWQGWKGYWAERFSFLENYEKVRNGEKLLPSWSDKDVEEFIASDPVHGPTLKTAREAAKFGAVGSAIGALSSAGVSWRYSRSPHGAVLSLGAGAVFGWTFGQEVANHWLQLYRLDTMAAQVKFLDWWERKNQG